MQIKLKSRNIELLPQLRKVQWSSKSLIKSLKYQRIICLHHGTCFGKVLSYEKTAPLKFPQSITRYKNFGKGRKYSALGISGVMIVSVRTLKGAKEIRDTIPACIMWMLCKNEMVGVLKEKLKPFIGISIPTSFLGKLKDAYEVT